MHRQEKFSSDFTEERMAERFRREIRCRAVDPLTLGCLGSLFLFALLWTAAALYRAEAVALLVSGALLTFFYRALRETVPLSSKFNVHWVALDDDTLSWSIGPGIVTIPLSQLSGMRTHFTEYGLETYFTTAAGNESLPISMANELPFRDLNDLAKLLLEKLPNASLRVDKNEIVLARSAQLTP
jgi:hypothetical protein